LTYFSFSNPNPNLNPTHSPKHEFLSPNNQFYHLICYVEYQSVYEDMATSQKFRLAPESAPAGFCVFISNPESKFCEKPDPESLFNLGRSMSLRCHFLSKNMGKFRLDLWL